MPPKKKKIKPADERFVFMNDQQLKEKRDSLQKHNTVKADKKAEKTFMEWLSAQKEDLDYWNFSIQKLDKLLCNFYFEVRTVEGDRYKTASLGALRYGINRMLQKKGYDFDIIHGPEFCRSSSAFSDACKELKAMGKGKRDSYKEITLKGMCKRIQKSQLVTQIQCKNMQQLLWNK